MKDFLRNIAERVWQRALSAYATVTSHNRIWLFVRIAISGALAVGLLSGISKLILRHPNWQPYLRDFPDISAYALAVIGAGLPFLPELLKMLESRREARWFVASICLALGIFAITSNHAQRVWDDQDKKATRQQLTQILNNQATHEDIKMLDQHMSDGFAAVIAAIKGEKLPEHKQTVVPPSLEPQLPPALVQKVTATQRRVPSPDPNLPYGLQVVIQTNVTIQPVGLAFQCTGEVGKVDFFVVGSGVSMNVTTGIGGSNNSVAFVKFSFPPVTPEAPLVVTLLSKTDIRVTEVAPIH
jgi:hypothetical protein